MTTTDILTTPRTPAGTTSTPVEDLHVRGITRLITPTQTKEQFPVESVHASTVAKGRAAVRNILSGEDPRMLVVVGPCSIHDPEGALDYATRLADVANQVADRFFVVMRCYFEKPRTTVGWKGFINDPLLDDSCDLAHGIAVARRLLLQIAELGLPTATEFLDPIIPQYLADLVTWAAIGARTTESQTHREMSSGLSMPVGFKNGTDGSVQTAIDAMRSARAPHSFLGIDQDGSTGIVKTTGNPDTHLVLRGGRHGANYAPEHVAEACRALAAAHLRPALMVDCSHANSGKDPSKQPLVWNSILSQRAAGRGEIVGAMIESNLRSGCQPPNAKPLAYGVSITDACMDWEMTERLLRGGSSTRD